MKSITIIFKNTQRFYHVSLLINPDEHFEKEDLQFAEDLFCAGGMKYKKCYCGVYYSGSGNYCSDACRTRNPVKPSWWLKEGKVWRETKNGLEEVIEVKIPS